LHRCFSESDIIRYEEKKMNRFENITKPLMWFMALLLAGFVAGCGSSSSSSSNPAQSSAKDITAFSLAWTTGGGGLATGIIDPTLKTIKVTVPYGTLLTPMTATFTTTGASVTVDSGTGPVPQVSGVAPTPPIDFTNPVAYKVTGADGTWATYTVVVTVAVNTAKAISTFTLANGVGDAATKTSIGTVIAGLASPFGIAVTMPYGTTDLTALVATFTTTGSSVKISGVTQNTGALPTNDFTTPVVYTVTAADGTTATYNVTVIVALNSAKAITLFSLAAVSGVPASPPAAITGSASPFDILVTMPNGTTDLTALVATFTATGASSVKVATTLQKSGTSQNDFSAALVASGVSAVPVKYDVTAADSSTATYNVTVTVSAIANPTAPTLGEAGRFVILASQGVTGGAGSTIKSGDIGVEDQARTFITGFTPTTSPADGHFTQLTGSTWTDSGGMLSRSYAPDDTVALSFPAPLAYAAPHTAYATTLAMITKAKSDLGFAYGFLATDPNPGVATTVLASTELGGKIFTPGVYKTAAPLLVSTPLQLDAQGDTGAVWIFTTDSNLTTGATGNMTFVNNVGSAKNVYWRVGGIATIATNTIFLGSVFAYANVDVATGANITGSLYSTTASVTLLANTVTKAP